MRLSLVIAHLVFAVAGLNACGKTDVAAYTQGQPAHRLSGGEALSDEDNPNIPSPPIQARIRSASTASLYCEQSAECNPAVALISVVVKKAVERCSGFLIGPNLVMTNDHCLKHSVAVNERGGNCQNLIFAHFAQAGGAPAQTFSCSKIVYRSFQKGLGSQDFAILQLDAPVPGRGLMRVSNRGFRNGELATIYRIQMRDDASTGTEGGVQVRTQCRATYGTLVYPMLRAANSPLMTFSDCPIQLGNSGSPILNESGELAAILQGYLTPPKEERALLDELQSVLLDQHYGQVAIATQLACVPGMARPSAGCSGIPEMYTLYPRRYLEQIGEFSARELPALGPQERWRRMNAPSDEQRLFIRTPVCVTPGARAQSFQSSVLLYQRGINRSLLPEWRAFVKPGDKTVTFEARGAAVNGAVAYSHGELGTIQVPVCTRFTQR